jgi:hypothetical protein
MTGLRKFIGFLILLLMGIPILFGIIWAVGLTKAAVSPEMVSELPREIIEGVPAYMDEFIAAAQKEDVYMDDNERAWINALAEADISIRDLMQETGISNWLEGELADSLETLGAVLRGERRPDPVVLDFRPLKKALQHEAIDKYLLKVLEKLPPCSEDQLEEWKDAALHPGFVDIEDLPACRPAGGVVADYLKVAKAEMVWDMPDEVELFEGIHRFPRGLNVAQSAVSLSLVLFLIPAAFIFLGALVAATSKASFFRWSGVSTLVGGLSALGLAYFAKNIVPWAIHMSSYHCSEWTRLEELAVEKLGGLGIVLTDYLFSPVISVAGVVCVIGVILFALSFAFTTVAPPEPRPQTQPSQPQPTPSEPQAAEEPPKPEAPKES